MKKVQWFVYLLIFIMMVMGCAGEEIHDENILAQSWEEYLENAKGTEVNLYMWGGSSSVNQYIDDFVAPRIKGLYDIGLNRIPIDDAREMINKLMAEKQVDKQNGSIDVMWINGENFQIAKEEALLFGPFVDKSPNYLQYVNHEAVDLIYDFGISTDGFEMPFGKAQFVLVYDSARLENPPASAEALKKWVADHPNKFTYPAPPDFTGSAFLRNMLYEVTGGYEQYLKDNGEQVVHQQKSMVYQYLNDIKPYLWREGKTYPESSAKLDQLYASGEVWMTMSYNPMHAENKISSGEFPKTSKTFVLDKGTLSNTHYLAIPFNASNKKGAMVVIDYLLSPAAQIEKLKPEVWGDGMVLDTNQLSDQENDLIRKLTNSDAVLSQEKLQESRVPEMPSTYVDILERGWKENVAKE
ncbi:MAG: ABC transporter substrate-binding protein [Clostridia bacterium]|nr:ABC transporter substrate-binding protein [Clostridia bacterium]